MIGRTLAGRYRIVKLVGSGGMGAVYQAKTIGIEQDVAIKILREEVAEAPGVTDRFEREAKIMASLRHPNVPRLFDFGRTADGRVYLVSEYIPGHSLLRVLRDEGPVGGRRTLRWMRQIASVLGEAHQRGIVHRDLKPANLMIESVGGEEVVKILDFGIAHVSTSAVTASGSVIGTPGYMAPEQIAGQYVDGRADFYALGAIGYECLSGRPPFEDPSPLVLLYRHIEELPRSFRERTSPLAVHPAVEDLIMRLLSKQADARPPSAASLVAEIDDLLRLVSPEDAFFEESTIGSDVATTRPITENHIEPSPPRRLPVLLLVGAALVLAAGAAALARRPAPIVATPLPAAPEPQIVLPPPAPVVVPADAGVPPPPPRPFATPRRSRAAPPPDRDASPPPPPRPLPPPPPPPEKRHPRLDDLTPGIPGL
jgi:serine/threonine-protein kinase